MSELKVNKVTPRSGTTVTLGDSGDTITIPSGATLDVTSATVSGITSYTDTDALDLFNASGSAPVYASRAWVNFNGTGVVAIRASGNVSSITDGGTGDYTVNFTTAMSDTDYAVYAHGSANAGLSCFGVQDGSINIQISSVRVRSVYSSTLVYADSTYSYVAIFR
jgi:hypothetical protein